VSRQQVGVVGASSLVGECLLKSLRQADWQVLAYSRQVIQPTEDDGVTWQQFPTSVSLSRATLSRNDVPLWICAAPIWVLPEHFALLEAHGARRVVVVSSTSRFTKDVSSDPEERVLAHRLAEAEACVQKWAENHGVEWIILRPTLIYGLGRDKNISEIARFIQRVGFFPLFGRAGGLRQPLHAQDVADACMAALQARAVANRAYNLSGGETLAYRDMVTRVFAVLGCRPRLLAVPMPVFRVAVALLRCLPRYRHWSTAMAERMSQDLVFDHSDAVRDFGFSPRLFVLDAMDVPTTP